MRLLTDLAQDGYGRPLASDVFRSSEQNDNRERIDRVLARIHEHYTRELSLPELANVAALSVSALHRMFRKHARTNVSEYITRIRIPGDVGATREHRAADRAHLGRGRLQHLREFQPAVQAAHVEAL